MFAMRCVMLSSAFLLVVISTSAGQGRRQEVDIILAAINFAAKHRIPTNQWVVDIGNRMADSALSAQVAARLKVPGKKAREIVACNYIRGKPTNCTIAGDVVIISFKTPVVKGNNAETSVAWMRQVSPNRVAGGDLQLLLYRQPNGTWIVIRVLSEGAS